MMYLLLAAALAQAHAKPDAPRLAEPLTLHDGERIVFLGSTLFEREPRYGRWETYLTSRYPGKKLIIRNLGWSGDTVYGDARAGFGTPADGFKLMVEQTLALKPSLIFLGYGLNESFDGEAGLERFQKGLDKLLDALAPSKARIVLVVPPVLEKPSPSLPDPKEANERLSHYDQVLFKTALARKLGYVTLQKPFGQKSGNWTENGVHLSDYGYWQTAHLFGLGVKLDAPNWTVNVDWVKKTLKPDAHLGLNPTHGPDATKGTWVEGKALAFTFTDTFLPTPPLPAGVVIPWEPRPSPLGFSLPIAARTFRAPGLEEGKYQLSIDGQVYETFTSEALARGVELKSGPEFEQLEKLRQKIVAKNKEYFHRWRPENETYLFGFRKREQGQNAVEVPKFEPIVEKLEAEIAELAKPKSHTYELKRIAEEKKP